MHSNVTGNCGSQNIYVQIRGLASTIFCNIKADPQLTRDTLNAP